jgi:hypothetical protein
MSTKRLQKTVIEGGRVGRNKWERRNSHNSERTSVREFCDKVKCDPEAADELFIKEKEKVYKEFDDKLGPMYRWLTRQVGKPWDEVRSEIVKTFDTRTTAGRHIVYDHLLLSVEVTPNVHRLYRRTTGDENTSYYKHDYYVNDNGILCQRKYIPRHRYTPPPAWDVHYLADWLNGRLVNKVGNKYFWYIPVDRSQKRHATSHRWITKWGTYGYYGTWGLTFMYLADAPIYKIDSSGRKELSEAGSPIVLKYEPQWFISSPGGFRQGRQLNTREAEYWESVPEYYQNKILGLAPIVK